MFFKKKVENPKRLKKFIKNTADLDWNSRDESLLKLYVEINSLLHAEIDYYYKKRKSNKHQTKVILFLIFIFTTTGILCPLIGSTLEFIQYKESLSYWGYVFFALAGALFTFDKLFYISSGYIKFATTQLMLEKEMNSFRFAWNQLLANKELNTDLYFNVIFAFSNSYYSIIDKETTLWGEELRKAMEDVRNDSNNKKA